VSVDFGFADEAILITATAATTGQTGVEMEALTAVALAGLTLHDMVKAVDPAATLTDVRLEEKTGGTRGTWTRDGGRRQPGVRAGTAAVIVSSTAAAAGLRNDTTGPEIAQWLARNGYAVDAVSVVADAGIRAELERVLTSAPAVIITTGGTGVSPSDRTPEATRALLDHELPGIAEAIRARGAVGTPTAALSRALAGTAHGTVVVNLPGSVGGVRDGLAVLDGVLAHLVAQVAAEGNHG
jgi:cyclic pyranopterin phosphate synthase